MTMFTAIVGCVQCRLAGMKTLYDGVVVNEVKTRLARLNLKSERLGGQPANPDGCIELSLCILGQADSGGVGRRMNSYFDRPLSQLGV